MIRQFNPNLVFDNLYAKAERLYDKGEYRQCIKHIGTFYHTASVEGRGKLLPIIAYCYWELNELEFAIIVMKHAEKYNPNDGLLRQKLVEFYVESGNRYLAQTTFLRLSFDELSDDSLQEMGNILSESDDEECVAEVPYEDTRYRVMSTCEKLAEAGHYKEAIKRADALIQSRGYDAVVYNKMALYACADRDYPLAREYARRIMNDEPTNAIACYTTLAYIFRTESPGCDIGYVIMQMAKVPANSIFDLMKVVSIIEEECGYGYLLKYLDAQEEMNAGMAGSYAARMIRAISLYNLGRKRESMQVLDEIGVLYGDLGYSRFYRYEFGRGVNKYTPASAFDEMPYSMKMSKKMQIEKLDVGNATEHDILTAFIADLILLNKDTDVSLQVELPTVLKKIDPQSIMIAINMDYNIHSGVLCSLYCYLVTSCNVREVEMNTSVGIVKFPVEVYPSDAVSEVVMLAHVMAQVYCAMTGKMSLRALRDSADRLWDIIKDSDYPFDNPRALAACIVLDSYIMHDDLGDESDTEDLDIDHVSEFISTNPKLVRCYLAEIRKRGEFFNLNFLEIFIKQAHMFYDKNIYSGRE